MTWSLNSTPIVKGTLRHPAHGNWHALVQTTDDSAPIGACVLALPGLSLTGTIIDSGTFAERTTVRIVGGNGGLANLIDGQDFTSATGRDVARSILMAAGEALDPASDAPGLTTVLAKYAYFSGPASVALDRLCAALACSWWVTPAGLVRLGVLAYPAQTPTGAMVQDVDEAKRRLLVALEDAPVLPGTTLQGYQVQVVEHELTPDTWRATVRYSSDPLRDLLGSLMRQYQLRCIPPLDATVQAQAGSTLTLALQLADDTRALWGIPLGLLEVPLALQGLWQVTLELGARVLLEYLDSDPAKPIVRTILSGTILTASMTATTSISSSAPRVNVGSDAAVVVLAGGTRPVIRGGGGTYEPGDEVFTGDAKLQDGSGKPCTGNYDVKPTSQGTVLA